MNTMTVRTIRRVLLFIVVGLAMTTLKIEGGHFSVAGGAIYGFIRGTRPLQVIGDRCMALGALDVLMNGIWKCGRVYIQGNSFTIHHLMDFLVVVALHAGIIRNPGLNLRDFIFVRRVAGGTSRNDGGIFFPEFSFYDLFMRLFDFCMTLHTGSGYPVRRNRGVWTCMRQNKAVVVAIVAGGCHNEPCFKQAPAMDALGIVFYNVVFGYIVYPGHHFSLPVTLTAQKGDIHFIGTGSRIGIVVDVVMPVALLATGSIGIIF